MPRRTVTLSDAQWARMEPHLRRTRRSPKGGRPRISNRAVVEGILWVLKTGARWRALPEGYASGSTCWRRLRQWDEEVEVDDVLLLRVRHDILSLGKSVWAPTGVGQTHYF